MSIAIVDLFMAVLAAIFGAFIIAEKADFKATGTVMVLIFAPLTLVTIFVSSIFLKHGLLRIFGIKWEEKIHKVLNDNIIKGHILPDISDQKLLELYNSLERFKKRMFNDFIRCTSGVVILWILIEYLASGYQLRNVFIILAGGFIASVMRIIFGIILFDILAYPARKECKMLLVARNKHFEETHFITLNTKLKFFIILTILTLATFLFLVYPLTPILIMFSIVTLFVMGLLSHLIFNSIYKALMEIKESAEELAEKRQAYFFSGSSDKEILDLSQSLNKTSQKITDYQEKLEKTKENLQERVNELDRWYKLTVGREVKMMELKKEVKKLSEDKKINK